MTRILCVHKRKKLISHNNQSNCQMAVFFSIKNKANQKPKAYINIS